MGPLPDMSWLRWVFILAGVGAGALFVLFVIGLTLIVAWALDHIQIV